MTLIELLVTVSVIAILVALLLPALTGAMEKASMSTCVQNLKSISQALIMYGNKNAFNLPSLDNGTDLWDEALLPYLDDETATYLCPSDPYTQPETTNDYRTYSANGGAVGNPFNIPSMRLEDVKGPASGQAIILLGERPGNNENDRGYLGQNSFYTMNQTPSTVHKNLGGGNYLFHDLSVRYQSSTKIGDAGSAIWLVP